MRIVQLTPGAGDSFYCENCLRDHASVREMRRQGCDVMMVPLYLPTIADGDGQAGPIFFGGVNVYLQQKTRLFRHTPRWLDKLFDARWLLRWAGRKAGMTRSRDLAETTLSVLRGAHGNQVKELNRLLDFLESQHRPDVVHLSNALLTGLADGIRDRLGCRVTCGLEDEEAFVDALEEPWRSQCWDLLRDACARIDGFISSSGAYAGRMAERLGVEPQRVAHVPDGVDLADYAFAARPAPDADSGEPAIGFLSQMTYGKGLDLLAEAFIALRARGRDRLRLIVCGGRTHGDGAYVEAVRQKLAEAGAAEHVEFMDAFDMPAKERFFRSVQVVSVPTRAPEAGALYALESMAAGVPLVLPDHGVNFELARAAGGIVLARPRSVEALVEAIGALLDDPPRRRELGQAGRRGVEDGLSLPAHGRSMIAAFTRFCGKDA